MENIMRRSPVSFDAGPAKAEMRDNWSVTLRKRALCDRFEPPIAMGFTRRGNCQGATLGDSYP